VTRLPLSGPCENIKKRKQSRGMRVRRHHRRQRTRRTIFLMCFDSRINELASCCQSARKRLRPSPLIPLHPPPPPPPPSVCPAADGPAPFHIEFASIFPLVPISPTPHPVSSIPAGIRRGFFLPPLTSLGTSACLFFLKGRSAG